MHPIISLQSVHKSYGTKQVLNGINLTIQAGQVIGYIGPNGAGKSTTASLIQQFYSPDKGEILYNSIPAEYWGLQKIRNSRKIVTNR